MFFMDRLFPPSDWEEFFMHVWYDEAYRYEGEFI